MGSGANTFATTSAGPWYAGNAKGAFSTQLLTHSAFISSAVAPTVSAREAERAMAAGACASYNVIRTTLFLVQLNYRHDWLIPREGGIDLAPAWLLGMGQLEGSR